MTIDLDTLASTLNLNPKVRHLRNHEGVRILYSFDSVETKTHKDSGVLASSYGMGATIREAKIEYARAIQGKILVHNAYSSQRQEYQAPLKIDVLEQPGDASIDTNAHVQTQLNQFLRAEGLHLEVQILDPCEGSGVVLRIPSHGIPRTTGIVEISANGNTFERACEDLCQVLQGKTLVPHQAGHTISAPLSLTSQPEPSVTTPTP
jgi:hypothetical protein